MSVWKRKPGKVRRAMIKALGGVPDEILPPPELHVTWNIGVHKLMAKTFFSSEEVEKIGHDGAVRVAHMRLANMLFDQLDQSNLVRYAEEYDHFTRRTTCFATVYLADQQQEDEEVQHDH